MMYTKWIHKHNHFKCWCHFYCYSLHFFLQVEAMDETGFKKLLLQFEKRVYKNQEMRIKYPDLPEKYDLLT